MVAVKYNNKFYEGYCMNHILRVSCNLWKLIFVQYSAPKLVGDFNLIKFIHCDCK